MAGKSESGEICFTPAAELASRIWRRDLSPVEVVEAFLRRVEERNGEINAYVTVIGDEAREAATEAERAVMAGELLGPLHGVPAAIKDLFDEYDLLVTPTLAVLPFDNVDDGNKLGPSEVNGEEVDPLLGWCLTYPINFTGHPAASVPAGSTGDGLPVGVQIVGRRFDDWAVLAASAAFQRVRPLHDSYDVLLATTEPSEAR